MPRFSRERNTKPLTNKLQDSKRFAARLIEGFRRGGVSYSNVLTGGDNNKKTKQARGGLAQGTTCVNANGLTDWKGLSFNVTTEKLNWLVGSYVGTTVNLADVHLVQKFLYKEGQLNLVATPMGGNLVLLTSKDNSDAYSQLSDMGECLEKVFLEVMPWEPDMVPRVGSIWNRVIGTPVHAWGDEFFRFLS